MEIKVGSLSQYGELPTSATIAYRQEVGQLPEDMSNYDGVIAVEDCSHVGKDALLYTLDEWYRVIVFDCSGDIETTEWMQENRIVAELGYGLASQLDIVGQGGVRGIVLIEQVDIR